MDGVAQTSASFGTLLFAVPAKQGSIESGRLSSPGIRWIRFSNTRSFREEPGGRPVSSNTLRAPPLNMPTLSQSGTMLPPTLGPAAERRLLVSAGSYLQV